MVMALPAGDIAIVIAYFNAMPEAAANTKHLAIGMAIKSHLKLLPPRQTFIHSIQNTIH